MSALTYERALERVARQLAWEAHDNYKAGANNEWEGVNIDTAGRTIACIYGLPPSLVIDKLFAQVHALYHGPTFKV